ncbi:MAG: substrate-binding domain-containing protein [Alphaproteobacteria bacterium]|nr:substrate-binding domain-containing protein [Alphaproteobacteria bacterium]MDA8003452.1 substrate-binding domain-containing protein [Alphaproteobacteria bacterium]MDA8005787.1 substrate-binding domain-containing protein [Alphaproteobacteria bacterium]MDA8013325.1 substrate-binding domain-containing protein [Alphaproteobacteria bacterium]
MKRFSPMTGLTAATALAAALLTLTAPAAWSQEPVHIVGSSTVFPFTQAVAEEYASVSGGGAPVVESTGTGGGMKLFCGGVGSATPDIVGASREIKESEIALCEQNQVGSLTEVLIGYDGLSIAQSRSGAALSLTVEQIYLALAAEVPADGDFVENPHERWSDIDPALPDSEITVFGPPPTSGTRDAFVELAMEAGCSAFAEVLALKAARRDVVCARMRGDGHFVEAGENDNLIVQRLVADESALGIFGFSFLQENQDALRGVSIGGVAPSFASVRDRSYPLVRPLFFYIKNSHRGVVDGLEDFVFEYVDEAAIGDDGYLAERGLVPLSEEERGRVREAALEATPLR